MANVGSPASGFYPAGTSNVGFEKRLHTKWISGSSGAIGTLKTYAEIASVTHTGTGAYTIQYTQSYNQSQGIRGDVAQASYNASGACFVKHISDANEAANGTLKVLVVDAAGAAVEPTTGDVIHITHYVMTANGTP